MIDTRVFRRLLNIKQLSHAFLAYPSAIHTRFEHSLGVTHLADKMALRLDFADHEREIIRLAGLLHDIGHGPFSHLFESVLESVNRKRIDHDKISMMLIKEDPEISQILGDRGEKIIQLLGHKTVTGWDRETSTLAADIISGPLDADKMDYLRRDSYHIGVAYGQFDLPRVINTLRNTPGSIENRLCIDSKGKDAIEGYRLARYLMHAQVYKHHARIAGDQMFLRALDLAVFDENIISKEDLMVDDDLRGDHSGFLKSYIRLDDRSLYDLIINGKPGGEAACMLKKILQRKLLKRSLDFLPEMDVENIQTRTALIKMNKEDLNKMSYEIAEELNLKKHNVIAHLSAIPVGLYGGDIFVMRRGTPRSLDAFSPIAVSKSKISRFYVFGPDDPNAKQRISEYVEARFKFKLN